MINKYFGLKEKQTNVRTEILAGSVSFLTMAYIIFINPIILSDSGMDRSSVTVATCLVSAIACLLMGLIPKVPIAIAPGMGLNAFFTYTLVMQYKLSWQIALGVVFLAGSLFLLFSIFGIREKVIRTIPHSLISAIAAGIGLFLIFIGLQHIGVIVSHPKTLVTAGKFTYTSMLGLIGFFLMVILLIKKVRGAILIGIVSVTLISIFSGLSETPTSIISAAPSISSTAFQLDIMGALKLSLIGPIFALLFMDMFDTLGTIVACSKEAKLIKKDGSIEKISAMLGVDAFATILSSLLGTSPTTAYIESATGISEGGKSGLTRVITGLFFLLAIFFIPLISIVPEYATAPALIIVGIYMLKQILDIDFNKPEEFIPAFIIIVMMPLTFQISAGMAFGFISWGLLRILMFRFSEISPLMYLIMFLSLISLLV